MSYQQIRPGSFQVLPPVIKNLIIINGIVLMAQYTGEMWGYNEWISNTFALHNVQSSLFKPHQLITHLFMHGDFFHFLFNMFALWMFGSMLENMWNSKRFLTFYILCGLGAAVFHLATLSLEYQFLQKEVADFFNRPTPGEFNHFLNSNPSIFRVFKEPQNIRQLVIDWDNQPLNSEYMEAAKNYLVVFEEASLNTPTVGASGAVFGCLAAFGYLFPNSLIYIYMFIPVKAKWFVIIYAGIELWLGVSNSGGNIAHFAHLGGALIGFLLVLYWNKKNRKTFY